jgi:hypothetical protein
MPSQSGYQIVENREVVDGAPSSSATYYTAYNPNLKTTDYVIGPNDLQSFLDNSVGYSLQAEAARAPAYMKEAFMSVNAMMSGDLSGWETHFARSWGAAVTDPGWLLEMGTSVVGGALAAEGSAAAATSETTGALSNLGDANAVTNGSMLNGFGPKPGFSGIYNPESGRFLAYPSGETVMADGSKPVNLVDQFGGHRAVNQTLSDLLDVNPRSNLGFSFVAESDGTVSIGFNSGSVNINSLAGNGTRTVPLQYQQPIADALQKAMGLKVVLPR